LLKLPISLKKLSRSFLPKLSKGQICMCKGDVNGDQMVEENIGNFLIGNIDLIMLGQTHWTKNILELGQQKVRLLEKQKASGKNTLRASGQGRAYHLRYARDMEKKDIGHPNSEKKHYTPGYRTTTKKIQRKRYVFYLWFTRGEPEISLLQIGIKIPRATANLLPKRL